MDHQQAKEVLQLLTRIAEALETHNAILGKIYTEQHAMFTDEPTEG